MAYGQFKRFRNYAQPMMHAAKQVVRRGVATATYKKEKGKSKMLMFALIAGLGLFFLAKSKGMILIDKSKKLI